MSMMMSSHLFQQCMPYGLGSFDCCHRATLRRCPFSAAAVGIMQRGKSAPCIVVLRVRQGAKKADVRLNGETLEESQFFTYLWSILTSNWRSTTDVRSRIAAVTATMMRLHNIWDSSKISFKPKFTRCKSLFVGLVRQQNWILHRSHEYIDAF